MSKPELPIFVEPLKLANQGIALEGEVALSKLPRLRDICLDDLGSFWVELQFAVDENRQRFVKGRLKGQVQVECQRCLSALDWPVSSSFELAMVFSDEMAANLPRHYEPWLLPDQHSVRLLDMVEDEILLCVPVQASHPEGDCVAPGYTDADLEEAAPLQTVERQEKKNPFSVLAELKKQKS